MDRGGWQATVHRVTKSWTQLAALFFLHVLCLVAQSCLTLCDPMACSLPGSSVHGDSPRKTTGVGCHALLQEIFPTQGWNSGLPHCDRTQVSHIAGGFFTIWATREALFIHCIYQHWMDIHVIFLLLNKKVYSTKAFSWTSLVVQWLRIRLLMQEI